MFKLAPGLHQREVSPLGRVNQIYPWVWRRSSGVLRWEKERKRRGHGAVERGGMEDKRAGPRWGIAHSKWFVKRRVWASLLLLLLLTLSRRCCSPQLQRNLPAHCAPQSLLVSLSPDRIPATTRALFYKASFYHLSHHLVLDYWFRFGTL